MILELCYFIYLRLWSIKTFGVICGGGGALILFNFRLLDFDFDFGLDNQQDMLNDHDLCFICVEKF